MDYIETYPYHGRLTDDNDVDICSSCSGGEYVNYNMIQLYYTHIVFSHISIRMYSYIHIYICICYAKIIHMCA